MLLNRSLMLTIFWFISGYKKKKKKLEQYNKKKKKKFE